ncbi:MAG: hypothetical protein MSA74_03020 [Ruminococcus sp.]|nr:hypothetical protein [Ruminococcus sp.]
MKNCCTEKLFIRLRLAIKNNTLRKTICVRFGRIASLSAFVLFADGYVVRITYESFLDYSL